MTYAIFCFDLLQGRRLESVQSLAEEENLKFRREVISGVDIQTLR